MSYSKTIMSFVAMPEHANSAGNVHGGEIGKEANKILKKGEKNYESINRILFNVWTYSSYG